MAIRDFKDLIAWQKAMDLVEAVYRATESFREDERFGLTSQVRRASVSIPSNIAEGRGRWGANEFVHHLSIANGSLCEVETQLLIAVRLNFLKQDAIDPVLALASEVGKLVHGLANSLS